GTDRQELIIALLSGMITSSIIYIDYFRTYHCSGAIKKGGYIKLLSVSIFNIVLDLIFHYASEF
ncbi:6012_t:CDS:1, partial [Dentiscutata heterogama]